MARRCPICNQDRGTGGAMCAPCARSYDRYAFRDCSVRSALVWAARRARRFARFARLSKTAHQLRNFGAGMALAGLAAEVEKGEERRRQFQLSADHACIEPPDDCGCAGCQAARAYYEARPGAAINRAKASL
jgi:hypothetical protein